jgi:hypothetical protein
MGTTPLISTSTAKYKIILKQKMIYLCNALNDLARTSFVTSLSTLNDAVSLVNVPLIYFVSLVLCPFDRVLWPDLYLRIDS